MEWNVYYYNCNRNEIESFNIFKHYTCNEDMCKRLKKCKTKEEYAEALKSNLRYYFWSKAEWELIIEITENNRIFLKPWCGCRESEKIKIDVTDDTNFDWRGFAELHTNQQIYGNKAKIDVFDQVMFNWDLFVELVWDNRRSIKNKK